MPKKICTLNKEMTFEEARKEMGKDSSTGQSLRDAEKMYEEKRRKT